jgi:hypothetical protein
MVDRKRPETPEERVTRLERLIVHLYRGGTLTEDDKVILGEVMEGVTQEQERTVDVGTLTGARPDRDIAHRRPDQVAAAEAVSEWFRAEAGWGSEAIERWLEGFWETQEAMDMIEPGLLRRARTGRSAAN